MKPRVGARGGGLPLDAAIVWLPVAIIGLEIVVAYSRLPTRELYHVSGGGLEGGASRALVFLNFPAALIALAVLALLYEQLATRMLSAPAIVAAVLCAAVFWPGVVSQASLDAKPVNAVAAIGVLLTLGLAAAVARRDGVQRSAWHRA